MAAKQRQDNYSGDELLQIARYYGQLKDTIEGKVISKIKVYLILID